MRYTAAAPHFVAYDRHFVVCKGRVASMWNVERGGERVNEKNRVLGLRGRGFAAARGEEEKSEGWMPSEGCGPRDGHAAPVKMTRMQGGLGNGAVGPKS